MKYKSTKCANCSKTIGADKCTNEYGEICDFFCSDKCFKDYEKRHPPKKLARKFKYRMELQERIKGKSMSMFSMPITEKEFDKLLNYKFECKKSK